VLKMVDDKGGATAAQLSPGRRALRYIGPGVAIALIASATWVLWTMVTTISLADVEIALNRMPAWRIVVAIALTIVGHVALAGYDMLAIQAVRVTQRISLGRAAVGSLIANVFANTLGFPLLSGGSARYRVYSMVGAGLSVVGRLVAMSWVTMWSGILLVLGLSLLASPEDFRPLLLTHWMDRTLGALLIAALAGFVWWVGRKRRAIRLGGWTVRLPGAGIAIGMIAAGAIDLLAAAGALWVLLPPDVAPDLVLYIFTYTAGLVAGIAASTPGGLGVFEAAIVTGLHAAHRPDVAASLIMFRIIYFAVPLILALALLAGVELRHRRLRRLARRTGAVIDEVDEP
jgi:glycosyltransferase 2 family protein